MVRNDKFVTAAVLMLGIGIGSALPRASAFTEDPTRLMNQVTSELRSIRAELSKIASNTRRR